MSDIHQSHAECMAAYLEQCNEQAVHLQRIKEQGQRRRQQIEASLKDCDRLHPRVWTPLNGDQGEPVWRPK